MEFALNEEQRMLQESVRGYLEASCPLDRVRAAADAGDTRPADLWEGLVGLGVHAIVVPEEYGGVGLGQLEAALVAECLGGAVAPAPYVGSSVMAPLALTLAGSDGQKDEWLPRIARGETVFGVGVTEQIGSRESGGVTAEGGRLTGKAMFVLDGADADMLLIADSTAALHITPAADTDVQRLPTIDRTRSTSEVRLEATPADVLPGSTDSGAPLLAAIDAGRTMLAADTLGAAQSMLDQAVAYAKERRQFNRVIGSFQAVKHLCAEMASALEPCRSLVWYAAHAARAIPDESRLMACHAKAHLAEVGRFVARTATEVHGGMGFTDLLGLHYWFKRIGLDRQLLGAPEIVREEAAKVQGWV
ncbi:MAG: acyl-CoA dehydrogenase [Gammaproteobacteria bacterium]|nr:acyl-CoA dehydrogenase [Gammaproteobacteria bacterium]